MMEQVAPNAAIRKFKNNIAIGVMAALLFLCVIPLASVLGTLVIKGAKSVNFHFLITSFRPVGENGGIWHAICGSIYLLLVASIFAVPLGLAQGMFLARGPNSWIKGMTRLLLDAMTGIPAIIIGVFCYAILVRPHGMSLHLGHSVLSGGLALALIMLPIFARMTEQAISAIPNHYDEAALALGLSRRKVIPRIILRSAMPAVLTGLFLALSRIGGEAAPLLFTAFGSNEVVLNPTKPVNSLPYFMFQNYSSSFESLVEASWGAALVLVVIILAMRLITNYISLKKFGRGGVHI